MSLLKRHALLLTLLLFIAQLSFAQVLKPSTRATNTEQVDKDTIPPISNTFKLSKDKLDCVVKRRSDSSFYDVKTSVVEMYGNASIEYCDMTLEADQINYNTKTQIAEAFGTKDSLGHIVSYAKFYDGTQELQYHDFTFNFGTQKGIVRQLVTQQGEGIVRGEIVKKISDDESFIKGTIYTTCNLEHPHYYFTFDKSKIKNKKFAAGKNLNLFIKDIPTPLYFPFAIFPLETGKRAGFTRVTPGYDRQRGFELGNLGWYQPINENMSAIASSNWYTSGSWDALIGLEYQKIYKHRMDLDFRYSRLKGVEFSDNLGSSISKTFQFDFSFNQDAKVWPTASIGAQISLGQARFREFNVFDPNERLNSTYTSSINFNKRFRELPVSISSNVRYNQNTQSNQVSFTLPSVNISTNTLTPFRGISKPGKQNPLETLTLRYTSSYNNQINTADSIFFENPIGQLSDARFGARHSIPVSLNMKVFKFFNLAPSINYNEEWTTETYERRWDAATNEVIRDTISQFQAARWYSPSLGLNTNIFGMKEFSKGKIKAIRHVMRPSISMNYNPDFTTNDRIFKEVQTNTTGDTQQYSIFDGSPVTGPPRTSGGSIGFGLGNNLEMKVASKKDSTGLTKIKIFDNLNFNTSYNLAADSLNLQPISFTANTRLFNQFNLNFNGSLNPYKLDATTGRRINELKLSNGDGIAELTRFSFRTSGSFQSKKSESSNTDDAVQLIPNPIYPGEQLFINNYNSPYVDFSIPWKINWNYNFSYNRTYSANESRINISNAVSGNVDFNVTDNWRMSVSSGYDFRNLAVNFTNIKIRRELHCWQMSLDWSPVGTYQRYMFSIAPKSSLLRDLKLEKRRTIFDNNRP